MVMLALGEVIGRLGFFRLMEPVPGPPEGHLTPHDWATLINLGYRYENQLANLKSRPVRPSTEQARAFGGFENLPLIVLSVGRSSPIRFWASEQEDPREARHRHHVKLQRRLASSSRFGKHKVVQSDSGHGIRFDAPDAVVDAVRQVVNQARMTAGTPGR